MLLRDLILIISLGAPALIGLRALLEGRCVNHDHALRRRLAAGCLVMGLLAVTVAPDLFGLARQTAQFSFSLIGAVLGWAAFSDETAPLRWHR